MLNLTSFSSLSSSRRGRLISAMPFGLLTLLLGLALLPVVALIVIALSHSTATTSDTWPHLLSYVLPATLWQTLALLLLVSFGTILLGAGTAWLTSLCAFPGRRFFSWALILPLAVPAYIAAYTHVEFFDFSGPIQSYFRALTGYTSARQYWFPDIRTIGGAGFIFSVVLYPYVYMTCRLIFSTRGASALDIARSLGARPWRTFWRVGLPMARPALAAGTALALMETLNDIGAVEVLGVKTLTYAVFETWLNRDNLAGAVQLALLTLLLVGLLIGLERWARRGRNYSSSSAERPPALLRLSVTKQILCFLACLFPLITGLGIPLYILGIYAARRFELSLESPLFSATGNTLLLAILTALVTTLIAYGVLQYKRLLPNKKIGQYSPLITLGYAIPGTVLAIGLLIPIASFDNWLDAQLGALFGLSTGLLFSGSLFILVYACSLRFMAIAYGTVETDFSRLSPHVDMVARTLGRSPAQVGWQIHRPIVTRALSIAFLLVFVDSMKELSATLLLRPLGFETLATHIYDYASQAALEEAALAALLVVIIGLIPIVLLSDLTLNQHKKNKSL